jgi:hypothetical protein
VTVLAFPRSEEVLAEKIGLHGAQTMVTIEKINLNWQIRPGRVPAPTADGPGGSTQARELRAMENSLTRPIKKCWSGHGLLSSLNVVTSNRVVASNIDQDSGKTSLISFLNV